MSTPKTRPPGGAYSSNRRAFHAPILPTFGPLAQATGAHVPSHADKPVYSGEVRPAVDLFPELVAEPDRLPVYDRDERDRPVLLTDMRIEALLCTNQGTQALTLRHVSEQQRVAPVQLPEAVDLRVTISLTPPTSEGQNVLFIPFPWPMRHELCC